MRNSRRKNTSSISDHQQLRLFPPTFEEILIGRVNELEAKLDRQRKGQFGKIGALQKKYDELYADMEILKRGICQGNFHTCEIVEIPITCDYGQISHHVDTLMAY